MDSNTTEFELRRLLEANSKNFEANLRLSEILLSRGLFHDAEVYTRAAIISEPDNPSGYDLMGHVICSAGRPHLAEQYFAQAMTKSGDHTNQDLLCRYASCLRDQGKFLEARKIYKRAKRIRPLPWKALIDWAQMDEDDREFDDAIATLNDINIQSTPRPNDNHTVALARIFARQGNIDHAKQLAYWAKDEALDSIGLSEKGRLYDTLGMHEKAWDLWTRGKALFIEETGFRYDHAASEDLLARVDDFYRTVGVDDLPHATLKEGYPQPIFILGFPRSGTSLVEQMLASHPKVVAGGEPRIIQDLKILIPDLTNSAMAYPEMLFELQLGSGSKMIDNLRDYYLKYIQEMNIWRPGCEWFTDKMPLNDIHVNLIRIMFPQSPIIHMVRHPLDVAVSCFSNHLSHGWFCCTELASIARHYVMVSELVGKYKSAMTMSMKYEDLISSPETNITAILALLGEDYDERCLNFHVNRNYSQTASRSQVTEPLYDKSVGRYKNYLSQLEPIVSVMQSTIERLGYGI